MQFRWMVFQAAIATPVYYFCAVELNGQGLAPTIVAMGTAFFVTLLVSHTLDWFRARAIRKRDKAESKSPGNALVRSAGYPPQQINTPPIRNYPRKLV